MGDSEAAIVRPAALRADPGLVLARAAAGRLIVTSHWVVRERSTLLEPAR
jgi:hypothetical protein